MQSPTKPTAKLIQQQQKGMAKACMQAVATLNKRLSKTGSGRQAF